MTNTEGQCRCATQIEMWKPDKRGYWHLDSCPMYLNNRESSFAEGQGEWRDDDRHRTVRYTSSGVQIADAKYVNILQRQLREVTAELDRVSALWNKARMGLPKETAGWRAIIAEKEQELASLRADVERLRKALEQIVNQHALGMSIPALTIAKAALTQEGSGQWRRLR